MAAVDQGVPAFLQKVQVEASVRDGKFVGWQVRGLFPPADWQGIDLQPGDVITAVNGKSIERETDAYDVFVSLKTAPRLEVSVLRGAEPRRLTFEIVPRPN
ncbi:MAG TPA: hypothetical protein VFQ61_25020 [Polyangiaceae bacterium]|nr:hypothetical protein [Polyangiaceae bacterium]